jgi:hypothetical protein
MQKTQWVKRLVRFHEEAHAGLLAQAQLISQRERRTCSASELVRRAVDCYLSDVCPTKRQDAGQSSDHGAVDATAPATPE